MKILGADALIVLFNRIKYSPATLPVRRLSGSANGWHLAHNTDADGDPKVFDVNHDNDERWLNTNWTNPDNHWNGDKQVAFVRRKPLRFSLDFIARESFCLSYFLPEFYN